MSERIAVIGLGYVGLPVAVGMARAHGEVVGFDVSEARVAALLRGRDMTGELSAELSADMSAEGESTRMVMKMVTRLSPAPPKTP